MSIRSICIVGLDDFPVLAGISGRPTNGESVQHVLLARAWRDRGLKVSLVVYGSAEPLPREVDGIRVIPAYRPRAGLPLVRFAYPHATDLLKALRRADADMYYQSPSGMQTGITAWFCRRHGRRFVYRVASDVNCIPGKQLIRHWRDRKLYEYGLKRADLRAVQTNYQGDLLREHYGCQSERINMAVELPERATADKDIDVLWVSNLRSVKRPELLLEVARQLPDVSFAMVGGPLSGDDAYFTKLEKQARAVPNLKFFGAIAYHEVGRIFDRATLFANTSEVEGFPNTFLQAWIRGIPVVTFFDPDKLVRHKQLGRAVTSVSDMKRGIETLLRDAVLRRAIGERARTFALTEFAAGSVARRYLELLDGAPAAALRDGTTG